MDVDIHEPRNDTEFELYYDLRWRVLREPWTHARESSKDEHERDAVHLGAWCDGRLVGVGRLHFNSPAEAQVRYMAVEPEFAGRGIGGRVLEELEARAATAGAKRVVLNARENALSFYRKHHYAIVGRSETLFDAIVHWCMQKDLPSS